MNLLDKVPNCILFDSARARLKRKPTIGDGDRYKSARDFLLA